MSISPKKTKGFTLIEMAIVLVIMGLIIGLVFPLVTDVIKKGKKSEADQFMSDLKERIIGFAIMNDGQFPATLAELGVSRDPYGNTVAAGTLQYVVDPALAGGDVLCMDSTTTTTLSVDEIDETGATTTVNNVAFIVASAGRDITDDSNIQSAATPNATITDPAQFGVAGTIDEYDDIVEYATLAYLKTKICTNPLSDAPKGSEQSFADNMANFPGQSVASGAKSTPNAVVVNQAEGTVELGGNEGASYGCIWYEGTDAALGCIGGTCNWNTIDADNDEQAVIRAYFAFQFEGTETNTAISSDFADGFTFALIEGVTGNNTVSSCGGAGGSLGYAYTSGGTGLRAPKIAIEVDNYFNANNDGLTTGTPSRPNHVAIDYWENASLAPGDDVDEDTEVPETYIDPVANNCLEQRTPARTGAVTDGFLVNTTAATNDEQAIWFEDGNAHTMRVEITKQATNTGACGNLYQPFFIEVWIDGSSANISDLTMDLTAADAGTGFYTADTLNYAETDSGTTFDEFLFGWTEGTGGRVQTVTISDFGIRSDDI